MKSKLLRNLPVLFFIVFCLLVSCRKDPVEILPSEPVPINLTQDQTFIIQSGNTFAFDIFKKITASSAESKNILISPLSISSALYMTLNGANGTTLDSMLGALRLSGITQESINNSYKTLSEALLSVDKRVIFSIANSVWIENNFVVKKPFTDILSGYYNAESKSFDVTDPLAPKQINNWIETSTNGLIKNMVDQLQDNTVMLLINAIYFKGKWKSQFDINKTVQESFYKPDGLVAEVPMMKQISALRSFDGNGFMLAEIPYGQGNFVIDVILPDSRNGVNEIIMSIDDNSFNTWIHQLNEKETDISFPRFKYGFKNTLNSVLTDMGMGLAFTDGADFSNISDLDLLINKVAHQAFIETNEEGTEAAAATTVEMGTTSMPPPPLVFNVDHGFLYIIRETSTNSILFMGRVADPLAE